MSTKTAMGNLLVWTGNLICQTNLLFFSPVQQHVSGGGAVLFALSGCLAIAVIVMMLAIIRRNLKSSEK